MNKQVLDSPFQDRQSDFSHSFGPYFPLPVQGFGIILLAGGIYSLITLNLIGLVLIAIGIPLVFAKTGTTFNFSSGTFKDYFSLFKFMNGNWKNIPECEYISVFSTVESQVISSRTQTAKISNRVILVNLIHSRNQRLPVFKTDNKDEAFKIAQLFSERLNIDILDATGYEKTWINRDGKNE